MSTMAEYLEREKKEQNWPVLRGHVVGREILVFCPRCKSEHLHSWDPTDPSYRNGTGLEQLRSSHCSCHIQYWITPYCQTDVPHRTFRGAKRIVASWYR